MDRTHRDRIFTPDSAFAPVADPLEEHYEAWVYRFRDSLFPDHFCHRFKALLVSDQSAGVRPDLVLIDRQYAEWVLVEVEKVSHSWTSHVSPQLEKFRSAQIGDREVRAITEIAPDLDRSRLRSLLLSAKPRILVVCNGKPVWSEQFLTLDAELMVVRPLRNERLDLIMYADRQFQRRHVDKLSFLEAPEDGAVFQWYRIVTPSRMELRVDDHLAQLENGVSPCRTRKLGDDWYIAFPSGTKITGMAGRPLSILRFGIGEMAIDGQLVEV